ncbi:MAG: DUF2071 domain-containing protein [Verrucomicrobiae bacterium]|nr:DUF2071 domain-containing protein [Verrucomicrobiae bacterium]
MNDTRPPILPAGGATSPVRPLWPPRSPGARAPWSLAMEWNDLLFAHWPVAPELIAARLPRTSPALEPDTFEGRAWIGVVPFTMSAIHFRGWPPVPGASAFPELNVRTYVTCNGRPGVWFFSLDAASRVAVRVARATHHLPYFDADMTVVRHGDGMSYASWRTHRGGGTAELVAWYGPSGSAFLSAPGSLEHWLTERYRLFAADGAGRLRRCEIQHAPWILHPARAEFRKLDMTRWMGLDLPDEPPLLHFSRRLAVRAGSPAAV